MHNTGLNAWKQYALGYNNVFVNNVHITCF